MKIELNDLIASLIAQKEVKSLNIQEGKILFFSWLLENNRSKETIHYYENEFSFLDLFFCKHNIFQTNQIDDSTFSNLKRFGASRKNSATTINKRLKSLRFFMTVLAKEKYIDPFQFTFDLLPSDEKSYRMVDKETLRMVLENVQKRSLKSQLIIYLLSGTGIRRTELVCIELENIDFKLKQILLSHTKVRKIRYAFFDDHIATMMQTYINENHPDKYLFECAPGVRIPARNVTKTVETIKEDLNLKSLSPHQFRHMFGTYVYENSQDIELTRVLLGHSDYSMTKRYVHHNTKELKRKCAAYNPLSNL